MLPVKVRLSPTMQEALLYVLKSSGSQALRGMHMTKLMNMNMKKHNAI